MHVRGRHEAGGMLLEELGREGMEHEKSRSAMTVVISQATWCTIGLWAGSGQWAVGSGGEECPPACHCRIAGANSRAPQGSA